MLCGQNNLGPMRHHCFDVEITLIFLYHASKTKVNSPMRKAHNIEVPGTMFQDSRLAGQELITLHSTVTVENFYPMDCHCEVPSRITLALLVNQDVNALRLPPQVLNILGTQS